jgi:hypothetical protein
MILTDDKTIVPETPAEIIAYGWEVYRRSQQIPSPAQGAGELIKAQSRLFHRVAPHACAPVYAPWHGWDLPGITEATADLITAIHEHCGEANAAFASGQDGRAAA